MGSTLRVSLDTYAALFRTIRSVVLRLRMMSARQFTVNRCHDRQFVDLICRPWLENLRPQVFWSRQKHPTIPDKVLCLFMSKGVQSSHVSETPVVGFVVPDDLPSESVYQRFCGVTMDVLPFKITPDFQESNFLQRNFSIWML